MTRHGRAPLQSCAMHPSRYAVTVSEEEVQGALTAIKADPFLVLKFQMKASRGMRAPRVSQLHGAPPPAPPA